MTQIKFVRQVVVLAILALFPAMAGTTGRITGMITDASGSPVAGAKLTITSNAQGVKRVASSDHKGVYGFPTLLPGVYTLHAEAAGFAPQDRAGLVIHVDSAIKIYFTLAADTAPK